MALRFYLAGEASSDHGDNWRGTITNRCWISNDLERQLRDSSAYWEHTLVELGALPGGFDYGGAFIFDKGHYLYEDWHSGFGAAGLVPMHRQSIDQCDVMWVWLPKAGAGTWAEIGYAIARNIPVVFADQGEPLEEPEGFAFAFAGGKKYVFGGNAREAWDKFAARPMAYLHYTDYLNTAHWAQTRNMVFDLKGRFCKHCFSSHNLQVHHLTYARVGREGIDDLVPLCEHCHQLEHSKAGAL